MAGTPLASAFIRLRPDTSDFRREAERDLGDAGRRAGSEFGDEFGAGLSRSNAPEEAGQRTGGRFGGAFADSLKVAAGVAVAAVAGKAADALSEGFTAALDVGAARSKLQAQLGLTADESKRIGGVAGKLFAGAYGDSMEEVNAAVTSVIQNMDGMRGASSKTLEDISQRAITVGQVMNADVGDVTKAVSQLMRTGLAKNAGEAFDILTKGAQTGANASEDLLDTFNEYGTQFRKMGISGAEATGIIQQGLKGGARDADIVADAIKEFSIRATAGGKATDSAFKSLGLSGKQMTADIAAGGPKANAALDTTLDRLRGIKNPVDQAAIATALFGTQAEDLGAALFKIDPSEATKSLGALTGATDKANAALGDNAASKLESFKRSMTVNVTTVIANQVIPHLETLGAAFTSIGGSGPGLAAAAVPIVSIGIAAKVGSVAVNGIKTGISGISAAAGGVRAAATGIGSLASGFRSADAASSAFSGRMGTIGGAARSAFNAAASGARTAATATLSAASAASTAALAWARNAAAVVLSTARTVAAAVVQKAVAIATRAWAVAQLALNVVMSANPIALVVIAIAALVAGIVIAYRNSNTFRQIVDAAFRAVAAAGKFMWDSVLKPVFNFFSAALAAGGRGLSVYLGIAKAVWSGIAAAGKAMWDNVLKPIFGFLGTSISAGGVLFRAYLAIAKAVWSGISSAVSAGWNAIKPLFNFLGNAIGVSGTAFKVYLGIAKDVWNGVSGAVGAGWNKISGFFGQLKNGIGLVGGAFGAGANAIRSAWNKVQDYTKAPINFVIGTVYNKGIVGLWNKVMDWLHLPGNLRLGTLQGLASGGPMPVRPGIFNKPTAIVGEGNSSYPEYVIPTDPKYRGRAQALWQAAGGNLQMLQFGGIIDSVKSIASKAVNLGKDAIDLITNPGAIWDRLVKQFVPSAEGLRDSPWGHAAAEIPKLVLNKARDYALSIFKAFGASYGGDGQGVVNAALKYMGQGDDRGVNNNNIFTRQWGWPSGTPWCALFASTAIRDAKAGKRYPGYPTAAVEGFEGAMRHVPVSEGRAGDLATYGPGRHVNIIIKKVGAAYDTVGGNQGPVVSRYVRGGQAYVLRPLAAGGAISAARSSAFEQRTVFAQRNFDPYDDRDPLLGQLRKERRPLFDTGGFVSGWPFHASKPEAVLANSQWQDIHMLASRGARPPIIVNVNGVEGIPTEKQLTNALEQSTIMYGRW